MTIDQLKQRAAQAGISVTALLNRSRIGNATYANWRLHGKLPCAEAMARLEAELAARTGGGK